MLVLSRMRDEEIVIGSRNTLLAQITDDEVAALRVLAQQPTETGQMAARLVDAVTDTPIRVAVTDIRGDKVRLGVTAPKAIAISRSELARAKRRKQKRQQKRSNAAAAA
jgi:carbon storage regulator CsrA